jgi:hypothetical protein
MINNENYYNFKSINLYQSLYSSKIIIILFLLINLFIYLYLINKKEKLNKSLYNNIYRKSYYNNSLDEILKMKKVVYTVNLGRYDKLKKINKQKGWDYFAFIDSNINQYNDTNWTLILVPEEVNILNLSKVKCTRYLKLHPHLYFRNYSISIYIDATYSIIGDLDEFLLRLLSSKYSIFSLEHPDTGSIFEELIVVTNVKKEKNITTSLVRNKYKKEKFPDNTGLPENSLIIRKHNEENCIILMENWWDEIKNFSHRDQLSFNYAMWKTGIKNKYKV